MVGKEDFPKAPQVYSSLPSNRVPHCGSWKFVNKNKPESHSPRQTNDYLQETETGFKLQTPHKAKSQQTAIHLSLRNLPSYCRQPHLTPPHVRV